MTDEPASPDTSDDGLEFGDEPAPIAPDPVHADAGTWWSRLLTPKGAGQLTDPEVGRRMRSLDRTEKRWGYVAGAFVMLLGVLLLPSLLHTTYGKPTTKPVDNTCPHGFRLMAKTCETIYHPSDFIIQFCVLLAVGGVLLFAVWRSKRSLAIFTSLFIGLGSFFVGVPVVFLIGTAFAVWLLVRSWRLQRFGTTDGKEIRKEAVARNEAKREARRAAKEGRDVTPAATGRTTVEPSKRYTPKAKPRRR